MKLFTYSKSTGTKENAYQSATTKNNAKYIAGGTNLLDLMKIGIAEPDHLVDISELKLDQFQKLPNGGILLGAMTRNSDVANEAIIRQNYPILSRAILSGASPQLRNMATTGGNLLQRTRCWYFYDTASACNKRTPGAGCDAINGFNRMNAVLGGSERCIAVHPSDMCVALSCLDATVHTFGPDGARTIPINQFYTLPSDRPDVETVLKQNELITGVELPPTIPSKHWCYLKIRDRASFAFALVSVATTIKFEGKHIHSANIALGGVAPKPWRADEAEKFLENKAPSEQAFRDAAELALKYAKGFEHNSFKIELAKRAIVRSLKIATGDMV